MCDLRQCTQGEASRQKEALAVYYLFMRPSSIQYHCTAIEPLLQGFSKSPTLPDLLKCVVAFPSSAELSHYLLTVYWIWFLQL